MKSLFFPAQSLVSSLTLNVISFAVVGARWLQIMTDPEWKRLEFLESHHAYKLFPVSGSKVRGDWGQTAVCTDSWCLPRCISNERKEFPGRNNLARTTLGWKGMTSKRLHYNSYCRWHSAALSSSVNFKFRSLALRASQLPAILPASPLPTEPAQLFIVLPGPWFCENRTKVVGSLTSNKHMLIMSLRTVSRFVDTPKTWAPGEEALF